MGTSGSGPAGASILGAGILLAILTAVVSGVSTFVNSYAVGATNSDAFVTARNVVVALALVPVFFATAYRPARARLRTPDWARLVAIGVVGGGIPFLLFFHGLQLATAAGGGLTASFLYRTLFVPATVLGFVVLRERVRWTTALAAGLLLAGNALLLALTTPVWTDGAAFVLAATGLWAVEYTISKRTLRDLPSATVALGRMGFGAVFLVGYLAVTQQFAAVGAFSSGQWTWVLVSALLLTAFVATWYAALKRVDLGVATAILVLGFPVTWLLYVLVRGSATTALEFGGAVAVTVGVAVALGPAGWRALREFVRTSTAPRAVA
ncbi:MAG TPA: EamA family transporter [Thermoplasmata archaeon]|nr:EamA family transporter [Thermoplasmata archaeon]